MPSRLRACWSPAAGSDDEEGAASGAGDGGSEQLAPIKLSLNQSAVLLPLYVAIDRGDFEEAGLTVEAETSRVSAAEQLPRLARGDIDIAPILPGAALFNQIEQGFDVKAIASNGVERSGRLTPAWLTLTRDVQGEISDYEDLEGRTIEGASEGTPIGLLAQEAVRLAGFDPDTDVELTYRVTSPPDMLTLAERQAADVIGMIEPFATLAEQQGLVERWKGLADVMPWYQPQLLGASSDALENKRESVVRFLEVYLAISREINETNGRWAPDFLEIASERLDVAPDVLEAQGGIPYFDPDGTVSLESLERLQEMSADELRDPDTDVSELVDPGPVEDAAGNL